MNWFKELTGFDEEHYNSTKNNLNISWGVLHSIFSPNTYLVGEFSDVSLGELKYEFPPVQNKQTLITLSEIVDDVQSLHLSHPDATFQVASQFNALEMVSPEISPLYGVTRYEWDLTQGPACAIACGAGTIYRNYFLETEYLNGQDEHHQLNLLEDLEDSIKGFWEMKNGYLLIDEENLEMVNRIISDASEKEYEELQNLVRIGSQQNTQVTLNNSTHTVNQIFCSALPVSYNDIDEEKWEVFAKFILEAMYEATILQSMENYLMTNSNKIFLTLLGGGAFGNNVNWIVDSISKVLTKYKHLPLDVQIVSYGESNKEVQKMIKNME